MFHLREDRSKLPPTSYTLHLHFASNMSGFGMVCCCCPISTTWINWEVWMAPERWALGSNTNEPWASPFCVQRATALFFALALCLFGRCSCRRASVPCTVVCKCRKECRNDGNISSEKSESETKIDNIEWIWNRNGQYRAKCSIRNVQ